MGSALLGSEAVRVHVEKQLERRHPGALTFRPAPPPERVASGMAALDQLYGGLPRGAVSEFFSRSLAALASAPKPVVNASGRSGYRIDSGRELPPLACGQTSVLHAMLAEATRVRRESCALVDASNAFDPASAEAAGVDLKRVLWVRCGVTAPSQDFPALERTLRATDLLLQAGGFGMVIVDLADVPARLARRIPLASWFRFRRAVEATTTVFAVFEQEPYARSCAALAVCLEQQEVQIAQSRRSFALDRRQMMDIRFPQHAQRFEILRVRAEALRSHQQPQAAREFAVRA
jgi:recombination protein RecA